MLMKLGTNCVMLHQVGVGVATCNLDYKVMNGVIDIGKIYNFCYGKAFVQDGITNVEAMKINFCCLFGNSEGSILYDLWHNSVRL
jgi:hypothetical protein